MPIFRSLKLGFKKLLNKEQIGNSGPFSVTNLPVYLINIEQIGISEQFCDDQKVPECQVYHSIKLPFDAEVAVKFLKNNYWCT